MSDSELIPAVQIENHTVNPYALKFNDLEPQVNHQIDLKFAAEAVAEKWARENQMPKGFVVCGVRFIRPLENNGSFAAIDFYSEEVHGEGADGAESGE